MEKKVVIKNIACLMFLFIVLFFYTGCASTSFDPIRVDLYQATITADNRLEVINGKYKFSPPDGVQIVVSDNPDLTTTTMIRPDGNISFPLLGDVYVEGLTPLQVRTKVHDLLKKYLRDLPKESVSVRVADFNSKKVFVHDGSGTGIQQVPFTGDITVLDAIASSGVLSPQANQRKITVIRGERDPNKKAQRLVLNLKDITKRGKTEKNIVLRPNDIVYIPPTIPARIGMFVQSLLFPVQPAEEIGSSAYRVQTGGFEGFAGGQSGSFSSGR